MFLTGKKIRRMLLAVPLCVVGMGVAHPISSDAVLAASHKAKMTGKQIAFNRKLGNCLACHKVDDGTLPGDVAPDLVDMKDRYESKKELREQIWDATKANPDSFMPPFGRHHILTESQIDAVVDYIYGL